jgi:hypothetical protein
LKPSLSHTNPQCQEIRYFRRTGPWNKGGYMNHAMTNDVEWNQDTLVGIVNKERGDGYAASLKYFPFSSGTKRRSFPAGARPVGLSA